MSKINLTPDQKNAVFTRSSSVLVSAAAGSGKTRVLTERLMAYITDIEDPKDIGSFLIITYTRAAAAELRSRILEELSNRSAEEPENRRLRRQSTLCYRAQIGTIHSFCTSILREYCYKIDLTPDFRVGDEDKCAELKGKALEKVLENAYEHIDENQDFAALVESVGAGRDDSRLASTVLELHEKIQCHPYPEKWAAEQLSSLAVTDITDVSQTLWGKELIGNAKNTALYWSNRMDKVIYDLHQNQDENVPIISAYGESLCETADAIRSFIRALDLGWDSARNALPIPFTRLKPLKNYEFEDRKKTVAAAREACKKAMEDLYTVFDSSSKKLLSELAFTAPAMSALIKLTLDFGSVYSSEKSRYNLLDFSDLEHLSVSLLCNEETGEPTDTAVEISKRYCEIMVDEYQDVNAVQDLIFRSVSRGGNNIFMVGDVKQSIYRFRLADPSIFIKKYLSYSDLNKAADSEPKRILLQNNFRSDTRILGACNHVFTNTMSEALGDISYDENAALFPPENPGLPRGKVLLSILEVPQAEDGEERPDKISLEAQTVAEDIKLLVTSGETILENGIERPVKYGDIAILLRSPGTAGSAFRNALIAKGIPVLAEQGGSFFSSQEILVVTSILSVIDNPHRDIPLTAALSSSVFGFTPDELSYIRSIDKTSDFYTALSKAAVDNEKFSNFIDTLSELRSLSYDIGVYELLCLIYDRFEIPALCAAMDGAEARSLNLSLLLDYALKFEENGYRGLYGFIKQLKRMQERGEEPTAASSVSGNAVTIMSIHKSKGLEFPVVFLANTSKKFNTMDLRSPVLIHPELGLGCKITDTKRGIEYPSLARRAIVTRLNSEMLSEEMRVLYVAMTRAKERLYISCTSNDPQALVSKISDNLSSPMSSEILKSSQSMAHWLISAALIENGGLIDFIVRDQACDFETNNVHNAVNPCHRFEIDDTKLLELKRNLSFRYPFEGSIKLPTKLTATSLPGEDIDREAVSIVKEPSKLFRLPKFQGEDLPLTGAERGIATHIVMQFIDFSRTETLSDIEHEVVRIRDLGQLTERLFKAVDKNSILNFFSSETGKRIKSADRVYREFRFSTLCPAEDFFENSKGEDILLQGVVDCCIEERGELTIIDYKTDYVTEDTLPELTERYKKQILAYAYAMSRILNKPVKRCFLCFLRAGLTAEILP